MSLHKYRHAQHKTKIKYENLNIQRIEVSFTIHKNKWKQNLQILYFNLYSNSHFP